MYNTTPLNWYDARTACQKLGVELASISNKAEHKEVINHNNFTSKGRLGEWWIGLEQNEAGKWMWSDNAVDLK